MKLNKTLAISAIAATNLLGSLNANAEMHLYWHLEGGGGGGCGTFCTSVTGDHIVIDGWRDDGTGVEPPPFRFGSVGGSGSKLKDSKGGKINGSGGHVGCTVPRNRKGIEGFLSGQETWKVYIDSSVSDQLQEAFKTNIDIINDDQKMRGRNFRVEVVSWRVLADTIVSTPTWYRPLDDELALRTSATVTRSGVIRSSFVTVTTDAISKNQASRTAASALAAATGLDLSSPYDPFYPNVVQQANDLTVIDPCTLAAIDGNLNAGSNK